MAVGDSILTSPDGIAWTSLSSGTSNSLLSVAWTGKQIVAVGDSGTILTSPDGTNWNLISSNTQVSLRSITWTGTQLVTVGDMGTILTSLDGITWVTRNSGTTKSLKLVVLADTQLVIFGENILKSADGVNWTIVGLGTLSPWTIIWTGTLFVGGFNGGGIRTSPDGVNWTLSTQKPTTIQGCIPHSTYSIIYTGTQFIAGGWGVYGGCIETSPDGLTWSAINTSGQSEIRSPLAVSIAWTGKQIIVVDISRTIFTAPQDPVGITPIQISTIDFLFRMNRNAISFSVPKEYQDKPVWATIYTLSGRKATLSQRMNLHEAKGSIAFGKLAPGEYLFELRAEEVCYTKTFKVTW
ncbi:MAG: hypothetical protein ABI036_13150 [Fibrobacteria bacterium]